jgi:hypothetical protein
MNPELLTPIGTTGWFAMLVIGPLRSGRYGELFLPIFLGMAIIDWWAVAPAAIHKGPSWSSVITLWTEALFPYAVLIYWMIKYVVHSGRTSTKRHD